MITFDKIDFGLAKIGNMYPVADESSPTGHIFFGEDFEVIETTADIEAQIGVVFGIRYRVRTTSSERVVHFNERIDHPMMTNPETGEESEYTTDSLVRIQNQWGCGFFVFEYDWEMARGEWLFSYSTLEGDLIHVQKFNIH